MGLWYVGQALHAHHFATNGHYKARTPIDDQIVHINVEIAVQATLTMIIDPEYRDYRYYHNGSFFDSKLQVLCRLVSETPCLRSEFQFVRFKQLLQYQLDIYQEVII